MPIESDGQREMVDPGTRVLPLSLFRLCFYAYRVPTWEFLPEFYLYPGTYRFRLDAKGIPTSTGSTSRTSSTSTTADLDPRSHGPEDRKSDSANCQTASGQELNSSEQQLKLSLDRLMSRQKRPLKKE